MGSADLRDSLRKDDGNGRAAMLLMAGSEITLFRRKYNTNMQTQNMMRSS
jgi:hypothetical protein